MTLTYEITSRELAQQHTVVVRDEMAPGELPVWLPEAYHAVFDYLQRTGVDAIGPPFARFGFVGDTVAVEAGAPVATAVTGEDRVEPATLPAGPAAATTHYGRYEDIENAYAAITQWLAAHGFEAAGSMWEIYYTDPNAEPDPGRWRTDIVCPYRRARG